SSYHGSVANPNKFCHGFGIFQYDLQFFKDEPDYFLQKRYADFDACLGKCIGELRHAKNGIGWQAKTTLTDHEMACVAIAYNTGPGNLNLSKGMKQGYFDGSKYYVEYFSDFLVLYKTVTLVSIILVL